MEPLVLSQISIHLGRVVFVCLSGFDASDSIIEMFFVDDSLLVTDKCFCTCVGGGASHLF